MNARDASDACRSEFAHERDSCSGKTHTRQSGEKGEGQALDQLQPDNTRAAGA